MRHGARATRIAKHIRLGVGLALLVSALSVTGPASADGVCVDAPASGGDWPVFASDATASGFQSAESTIGPENVGSLEPAWVVPLEGAVESEAVAAGGCVFIGTQTGAVYAFNVQTGDLAWRAQLSVATTLSIGSGSVFVQSGSIITALDQSTGLVSWQRDFFPYSSIGSPLAFDGYVVAGFSGCSDLGSRPTACRGYYVILDQATGEIVVDGHDVSEADVARGMEGPGFWSHPSYDPEDKFIYFGTANVRSIAPENPYSNALLKIDADPDRATFGEIVGYFHNLPLNPLNDYPGGEEVCGAGSPVGVALAAICIDDDDFPTTAVIYRDSEGRKLVGATHSGSDLPLKTFASFVVPRGNFFAIDPDTMEEVWRAPTTAARAAVSAYDGSKIYYSSGYDGGLIAVDKDTGAVAWQANTYGANVWQHVSAANGVVYTPSGAPAALSEPGPAMLLAFDAETGAPLLQRPLSLDIANLATGTVSGGVTIARNTVFIPTNGVAVGLTGTGSGYLVAYRLPA